MGTFTSGSRTAAVTVAVTLFTSTLAFAQTPAGTSRSNDAAPATLMDARAFARLVQPRNIQTPAAVTVEGPRLSLFRQSRVAMDRQAITPTRAPQGSWASRHKVAIIVVAAVGGFLAIFLATCYFGLCE